MTTSHSNQLPDTLRLAKKIKHLRKKGYTYFDICAALNIRNRYGLPDTGLAYQILHGREPGEEVRERLGLRHVCPKCHRPYRLHTENISLPVPEWMKWWKGLTRQERDNIIISQWAIKAK